MFLLACKGITLEFTLHVLILFILVKVARFVFFIGSKILAVLFTFSLLRMNVPIASFPINLADIMSDDIMSTLSVAIIPAEIEIYGSGLHGSINVASIVDNIF